MTVTYAPSVQARLLDHVDKLHQAHPPIDLATVDWTVRRPVEFERRFGTVLDYMARVELEVDRNVLELTAMLPDPPEIDRRFYAEVWQPQEVRHGEILDRLQVELGRTPAQPDTETVTLQLRAIGLLAHLGAIQDVVRMLYYLTGMATERSAVLAYNILHKGVVALGETAVADTVIAPIKRQEPGHYAFYQLSARGLWAELTGWQRWLVRVLRRASFAPVGVNNAEQLADFGAVMGTLGIDDEIADFAGQITRVEQELLWARQRGLHVPDYITRAFHDAVELARTRTGRLTAHAGRSGLIVPA